MRLSPYRPWALVFRCGLFIALAVILYASTIRIDSALPGGLSDKFWHGFCFFLLGWLAELSYPGHNFIKTKFIPLFLYGILIEIVQYFIPYRSFSLADMVADAIGLVIYGFLVFFLTKIPCKTKSPKKD